MVSGPSPAALAAEHTDASLEEKEMVALVALRGLASDALSSYPFWVEKKALKIQ